MIHYRDLPRSFRVLSDAVAKRPVPFFAASVVLLFATIGLASYLRIPTAETTPPAPEAKHSPAFTVGKDTARMPVVGRIRKETRIEIVALTAGQVRRVQVAPGMSVRGGATILTLTDDFDSRKRALERAIAENDAATQQKLTALDKKNRQDRRDITKDTLTGDDKDVALRSLSREKIVSESALTAARLRFELTATGGAALAPKTFASGIVEAVFVRPGDYVVPGTLLATLRADRGSVILEVPLDRKLAELFDPTETATITLDGETIGLQVTSFSTDDVRDGLFEIRYALSDSLRARVSDDSLLPVAVPMRSSGNESLIPLESVFQDASKERILIAEDGIAKELPIAISGIAGSFVRVAPALAEGTAVLTNRAIIAGDEVSPFQN